MIILIYSYIFICNFLGYIMFKRIFVLIVVLFAAISCKQNPSSLLSSTPPIADDGTIDDNTDGGNSNGGNTDSGSNSGYGVYNVFILGNNGTNEIIEVNIFDTQEMVSIYSNIMIYSNGSPKFKLSKNNSLSTLPEGIEPIISDSYIFDKNLNLVKEGSKNTISKKFRGVCIVRIYPDAIVSAESPLLGYYTIAGVYTEMEKNTTESSYRAMMNVDSFQNYGYDELIILRSDIPVDIKPSVGYANDVSEVNYRADILFNTDKGINFYYYDTERTFENQNTNYIFERIAETTTIE